MVLHRVRNLAPRVVWTLQPPRVHPDEVVLTFVDEAPTEQDVVAVVARALQRRRTTAIRLATRLEHRARLRRRRWVRRLLADLADGSCSVLEHGYLTRVERAHGLPRPCRQSVRRRSGGTEYRDVEYLDRALVVELDGKAFHSSVEQRENDYERDLDDTLAATTAVRLTFAAHLGTGLSPPLSHCRQARPAAPAAWLARHPGRLWALLRARSGGRRVIVQRMVHQVHQALHDQVRRTVAR